MVRTDAIIFILANIGSIFGEFSSPETRKSSDIFRYFRGTSIVENATTTSAKWVQAWEPTSAKPERIRQNIPSSDTDEKYKMLENLRAMEPARTTKHQVPIHRDYDYRDQHAPPKDDKWVDPTAPPLNTTVQSVTNNLSKENVSQTSENDTCNWEGGSRGLQKAGLEALKKLRKEAEEDLTIENVGQKLHNIWKCIWRKYLISHERIKKKVCRWFKGGTTATVKRGRHRSTTTTRVMSVSRKHRTRTRTTITTTTTKKRSRRRRTRTTPIEE